MNLTFVLSVMSFNSIVRFTSTADSLAPQALMLCLTVVPLHVISSIVDVDMLDAENDTLSVAFPAAAEGV